MSHCHRNLISLLYSLCFFFLMIRRPPRSTRTDTLFPYTTRFRSRRCADLKQVALPEYRGGKTGDLPSDDPFQRRDRSEEHTSELQSLMRISYAVFCLKKKKIFMQKTDTVTDAFKVQPIQTHIITFMRASIKTNTVLTIHSLV